MKQNGVLVELCCFIQPLHSPPFHLSNLSFFFYFYDISDQFMTFYVGILIAGSYDNRVNVTPRFLINVINANSKVKPVDIGQTLVNLSRHLENLVNNH
jgi:hypothetical protein